MNIVIPMAGLSQRFVNAGFTIPKYMLYAKEKSLFSISVSSFNKYFKNTKFIFIVRNVFSSDEFVKKESSRLGILDYEIVVLNNPTLGQADTVYQGAKKSSISLDEPILIFNIDTFRQDFTFPKKIKNWDGYLEVFIGEGNNWSYAKTENKTSNKVVHVAEKVPISNFCSTGIYFFRELKQFNSAFLKAFDNYKSGNLKEIYVAPLYNELISNGDEIYIDLIERDEVVFCGIPNEYFDYIKNIYNE